MDAVLADWTSAPVAPKLAGGLALVHKMTKEPSSIDDAFLEELRERGLSNADIEAASTVAYRFAVINRAADGFGFPIPTPDERATLARVLSRLHKVVRFGAPDPLFKQGTDGLWRPTDADRAREQLLTAPGVTPPSLRQAAEGFAARWFDAKRDTPDPPEPVLGFVGRVAAFPASIDDELVGTLRSAGYDDEAIFELTMAAAIGVASAGVEAVAARIGPRLEGAHG